MSVKVHEEEMMSSPNRYNSSSSVSNDECSPCVAKGKRTRRQRQLLLSPASAAPTSSTSSSSGEFSINATEEDEDMANCLILLAQGRAPDSDLNQQLTDAEAVFGEADERFTSQRLTEAATATINGKAGFYLYECKTCNKCFPSFQALGGHRASHKKPKTAPIAAVMVMEENIRPAHEVILPIRAIAPYPGSGVLPSRPMFNRNSVGTTTIGNNKPRVHECSICGSEFSSGQALGGHMRRHRAAVAVSEPKKEKSLLRLDLNLPAPVDDERGDLSKPPPFPFPRKQPLIFPASPLVDCHY